MLSRRMDSPNKAGRRPTSWRLLSASTALYWSAGHTARDRHAKPAESCRDAPPNRCTTHQAPSLTHGDPSRSPNISSSPPPSRIGNKPLFSCPKQHATDERSAVAVEGDVCRAAHGRRAAKWGQAADSVPIVVRARRQVTFGGAGDLSTPNHRLPVAHQRGAPSSKHEPPRASPTARTEPSSSDCR